MTFRDAILDELEMYLAACVNDGDDAGEAVDFAAAVMLGITSRVAAQRVDRRQFLNKCAKSWDIFVEGNDNDHWN